MHKVAIVGAGKIGSMIAELLGRSGDYQVAVLDRSAEALARLETSVPVERMELDVADGQALRSALDGRFAVLSAAPYQLTTRVAEAARSAGAHYLDLTEDVASTRRVKQLAEEATSAFIPQCGLAPGVITIVAADLCKRFEVLHDVRMRVGALPKYPSNALNYNLTWSTDGLINEYCEPCEAIVDGQPREVPALEEREEFSLDGVLYEAFNTSGGLGTLCETLDGKVSELNYKTIRYQGHREYAWFLVNELHLGDERKLFKELLERAIPITFQDVVVIFCTVSGWRDGQLVQVSDARKIYNATLIDNEWSAIQITTAAGVCTMVDLHYQGRLASRGFACQEQVSLREFLSNRFGRVYASDQEPASLPSFSAGLS